MSLIKLQETQYFQSIIRNLMKFSEFPVPTWGYCFFIFTWILQIFRILRFSVIIRNSWFLQKSENLCKIHTFSPDAENSNKPYGFIGILGEISQKIKFSLKIIIFTKNQLFHPKSTFDAKVHFSHFFKMIPIFFGNGPNYLAKT